MSKTSEKIAIALFLVLAIPAASFARSGGAPVDRDSGRNAGGTRGRAWINGREVGGTAPRFAHLLGGYD